MISVIDYGMGNLRSVVKAFELYTPDVRLIKNPDDIKGSKAIVLPGDGAFKQAMENLTRDGWIDPIKKHIADDGYFMGICLGFQLLFSSSEEFGMTDGLGIIKGKVVKFSDKNKKVPHMGWNTVAYRNETKFLNCIDDNSYFYFIHSYYPVIEDLSFFSGETQYENESFCSIAARGNLVAAQFHPEKSHNNGLKIIKNFVEALC